MDFQVILATPSWSLNGVNVFVARLADSLRGTGVRVRILLTRPSQFDIKPLAMPPLLPFETLPVKAAQSRRERWETMIQYLETHAPCIYIPNHDYEYSCVSSGLSKRVGIVGVVHSDDPEHYEHVTRLGRYWDSIVAVSDLIYEKVRRRHPAFSDRVVKIPHGFPFPDVWPQRLRSNPPCLRILYAGSLKQYQKRVLDLIPIANTLERKGVSFRMTIAGAGPDQERLKNGLSSLTQKGRVNFLGIVPLDQMTEIYRLHDVVMLTSAFEGMPLALLEAMGHGCVPVATDIASGVPEVLEHGRNGFRVPVGKIRAFVEHLTFLERREDALIRLSQAAYATIRNGHFRMSDMAGDYFGLFKRVMETPAELRPHPTRDKVTPPPKVSVYTRRRLCAQVRDFFSIQRLFS